jgi:DNA mismatch endonuclease (patch repair protein)
MADIFTPEKRSAIMRAIRSKNTKPEIILRRQLFQRGFRFRLHDNRLAGKPDITFPKYKFAIQVRGCFWHGHSCIDGHIPKSRSQYWIEKIEGNQRRDRLNDKRLRRMGWRLYVAWECECLGKKLPATLKRILKYLKSEGEGHGIPGVQAKRIKKR